MEEAIQIAKENGFTPIKLYGTETELYSDMLLNPEFWQALGRALGWKEIMELAYNVEKEVPILNGYNEIIGSQKLTAYEVRKGTEWLFHALRFFEFRLTGGDEEAYWKELLKN